MPSIDISRYNKQRSKRSTDAAKRGRSLSVLLNKDISFGGKQLPDKKKEGLYAELGSLLQAGIDLKSSLELIATEQRKAADVALHDSIKTAVIKGSSFSSALQETGRFSLYEVYSLRIGEESGKQIEVLAGLAGYYQNKIKQRRKIISALTYPTIVMFTSFGAVFFMLRFVVPMFGDVFKRFGGKLPWITEKIIAVSNMLERSFWGATIILVIATIAIYQLRHTEKFKALTSSVVARIPVVGSLVQKIYLARFCNSMRLLISAKLPLLNAIALIRQMIDHYPITSSLSHVEKNILSGATLHDSMKPFKVYPPKMIQLIKVGEETGKLDHFFEKLSIQYVEEVEYKTSTLSSVMEPIVIVFLGLIVGVILVSMYLPLFQMSNGFQ